MRTVNAAKTNTSTTTTSYASCPNSAGNDPDHEKKKMKQNIFRLLAIVLAVLTFIASVVITVLADNPRLHTGIFNQTISQVSHKYDSHITPARQTFYIWPVIYIWQVVWLLYGIIQIWRTRSNNYLYVFPPTLSTTFYLSFALNNVITIAWSFVWTREMLIASLVLRVLSVISLYLCLYCSFSALYKFLNLLYKEELNIDVWLLRLLVQNGLAFYAAWVSIASFLNLAIVLHEECDIDKNMAGTISLGISALGILLWFMLDSIILDKYVRYTFSPYIVLTVAFTGILIEHFNLSLHPRNSILTGVLLALSGLMLFCKFVTIIWLHHHQPIIIKAPIYALPTTHNNK